MPTTTTPIPSAAEMAVTRALINDLRSQGASWNRIAARLNELNIPTFGGGARWWVTNTQHAVGATTRQQGRTPRRRVPVGTGYLRHLRTYGVEVEWDGGRSAYSTIARAIEANGVAAHAPGVYTHAVPTDAWRIMQDGSCSGEAVSPILSGDEGLLQTRGVMRGLRSKNCGTGNRASVHLHVSVLDFGQADIARLLKNLRLVDKALHAYVADHRLNAFYCQPVQDSEWNVAESRTAGGRLLPRNGETGSVASRAHFREGGSGVPRYRRYNFNPILVYGTVEFRAHGATLNITKFRPWVAVTTAIIEATKNGWSVDHEVTSAELVAGLLQSGYLSPKAGREFLAGVERRNENPTSIRHSMLGQFAAAA
jgi:hypothetical protein